MSAKKRIRRIAKFAKEKRDITIIENSKLADTITYRWEHTLRVAQYGKTLAEKEDADVEIVVAACLLHDIAKLSHRSHTVEHGRIGAKMVRPFLRKLDFNSDDVKNICFSIATHVDGKADFKHPLTLEAKIVSDADKIDRLSPYRTIFAFQLSNAKTHAAIISVAKVLLERFQIAHREWRVQTESGKKIFNEQISVQTAYLKHLIADYERTALPEF